MSVNKTSREKRGNKNERTHTHTHEINVMEWMAENNNSDKINFFEINAMNSRSGFEKCYNKLTNWSHTNDSHQNQNVLVI